MTTITSLQNPRVKEAVRLRERRGRQRQGRIIIDGVRELRRALAAGVPLLEVFVCESLGADGQRQQVIDEAVHAGAEPLHVTEAVFAKLSFGERGEGLVGVARAPQRTLDELELPPEPVVAILEGIEKPGNVGAVLRSADAAGVSAVIVADGGTDLFNPNAIRASLGTIFTVPTVAAATPEVLDWLRRRELRILAARVDGAVPFTAANYSGGVAIALGSESAGLAPAWSEPDITAVSLPMRGVADSLNVSATAAVLFYEALRQREA